MATDKNKQLSLAAIAKKAKVSTGTVSRALNNSSLVNARTRNKVLETARSMGIRPRVGVRPKQIALITEPPHKTVLGGYVSTLTQHVSFALSRREVGMSLITENDLMSLSDCWFDGIIAAAWFPETISLLESITNVPVVWINRLDLAKSFDVVANDHRLEGRRAMQYFYDRGHRNVALIICDSPSDADRRKGMLDVLQENGIPPENLLICNYDTALHSNISRICSSESTAVWVTGEDMRSVEACWIIQELAGKKIPDDISVIGGENPGVSEFLRPPLTTVSQPLKEMAEAAVDVVLDENNADDNRRIVKFESRIIERESVANLSRNGVSK